MKWRLENTLLRLYTWYFSIQPGLPQRSPSLGAVVTLNHIRDKAPKGGCITDDLKRIRRHREVIPHLGNLRDNANPSMQASQNRHASICPNLCLTSCCKHVDRSQLRDRGKVVVKQNREDRSIGPHGFEIYDADLFRLFPNQQPARFLQALPDFLLLLPLFRESV